MTEFRRVASLRCVAVLLALGAGGLGGSAFAQATSASGCTSIASVPISYAITFNAAVQGLFNDYSGMGNGCTSCHHEPPGTPSGNLDLTSGVSWGHLVNVESDEDPDLKYVVPNHPELSLLFLKLNCDHPPSGDGVRMPFGGPNLSAEQQALIYDWIAGGAPVSTTTGIFRNGFDVRGLTQ